ncbi:hypothetical protein H6761_02970 [Candidatus Nomurabacteria bacterium]|nr:hypothetical protein [Candidatus Nomurabacteria bacterium]
MDFLELVKDNSAGVEQSLTPGKEKKKFQPLVYLVALILVVLSLAFWFSLKPSLQAFDFLPEETSFYWQWADPGALKLSEADFPGLNYQIAQEKLVQIQDLLQENSALLEEVIWFKKDTEQDYFLLKIKGALSKEELNFLNQRTTTVKLTALTKQIFLVSSESEQKDKFQALVLEKFLLAKGQSGVNLYLSPEMSQVLIKKSAELSFPWSDQESLFVHLDQNKINFYQATKTEENFSWEQALIPKKGRAILAFDDFQDLEPSSWQAFLTSEIFQSLPVQNLQRDEFLNQQVLLWENEAGQYLVVSPQDLRPSVVLFLESLPLKEESRTLADGTLYQELVLADLEWQKLAWPEQDAWQLANLVLLEQDGLYYLSNSVELLGSLGKNAVSDEIAPCLEGQKELAQWIFLDQSVLESLKLPETFVEFDHFWQFMAYHDHSSQGWQFCW